MIAYYFVDSDGTENVSNKCPVRHEKGFWTVEEKFKDSNGKDIIRDALVEIPSGTIELKFGKKLTFIDEPIKVVWNKVEVLN